MEMAAGHRDASDTSSALLTTGPATTTLPRGTLTATHCTSSCSGFGAGPVPEGRAIALSSSSLSSGIAADASTAHRPIAVADAHFGTAVDDEPLAPRPSPPSLLRRGAVVGFGCGFDFEASDGTRGCEPASLPPTPAALPSTLVTATATPGVLLLGRRHRASDATAVTASTRKSGDAHSDARTTKETVPNIMSRMMPSDMTLKRTPCATNTVCGADTDVEPGKVGWGDDDDDDDDEEEEEEEEAEAAAAADDVSTALGADGATSYICRNSHTMTTTAAAALPEGSSALVPATHRAANTS
jgi:hypothetical protein